MDTNTNNFEAFNDSAQELNWKQRVSGSHKKNKFSNVNYQSNASQEELNFQIEDTSYQIEDEGAHLNYGKDY